MNQGQYEAAVAEFLRNRGVTRCPTACVAPTLGTVADTDRAALRGYEDAREAARLQNFVVFRSGVVPGRAITPA